MSLEIRLQTGATIPMQSPCNKDTDSLEHQTAEHPFTRCRRIMKCEKVLCPVYDRRDTACWYRKYGMAVTY